MTTAEILSLGPDLDLFSDSLRPPDDDLIMRQLVPPLPIAAAPEPLLIWGWQIVRRASTLGLESLEVRIVDMDLLQGLKLALKMENRTGSYLWPELDAIVSAAELSCARTEISEVEWLELSRLVRGDGALREIVRRYRELAPHSQELVADGFISLKTAHRIQCLPAGFLTRARPGLARLSFSVRRQFLELVAELFVYSARGIDSPPISTSSEPRVVDQEQRAEEESVCEWATSALNDLDPLETVRRRRFPMLTRLERQFEQMRDRSLRGSCVTLTAPPYFEGDTFNVAFGFRNRAELDHRIGALRRLKDDCDDMFQVLQ